MFAPQTVLLLRGLASPSGLAFSFFHFRRRYRPAKSVMEVKQYLLRCVHKMTSVPVPELIMVDAGPNNADIKTELERWLDAHPRLRRVQVVFPPAPSWLRRFWK